MTRSDAIIAVKNVELSSKWYQSIFGCKSRHGGVQFDILVDENDEVLICLHKWGEHGHPTMINQNITPGNGLILYFRTENMDVVRKNVEKLGTTVEEEVNLNANTNKREFSIRDLDGYYLTISEFHQYEG